MTLCALVSLRHPGSGSCIEFLRDEDISLLPRCCGSPGAYFLGNTFILKASWRNGGLEWAWNAPKSVFDVKKKVLGITGSVISSLACLCETLHYFHISLISLRRTGQFHLPPINSGSQRGSTCTQAMWKFPVLTFVSWKVVIWGRSDQQGLIHWARLTPSGRDGNC